MAGRGQRTGRSTSKPAGTSPRTSFPRQSPTSSNSGDARNLELRGGAMKMRIVRAASMVLLAGLFETPVSTHHSFAMYDQTKTVTLTGVVTRFVAQANHAELHFVLIAPDRKGLAKTDEGKYVEWGVEMAGAAAVAQ